MRGNDFVLIETLKHATDNCRLAGPDLAGNDDESLVLMHAVFEVRSSPPVLLAGEIERRIRVELERLAGQPIECFIHTLEKRGHSADD